MNILQIYKSQGEEMVWTWDHYDSDPIRIKDMYESDILNEIENLKKDSPISKHWIRIFEDVLLKRRFKKIEKIRKRYAVTTL